MINFRKIVSVLTSAAMLGSTVALATAASYPQPFVKNGMADVAVVYGSTALGTTDIVAAMDINNKLTTQLLKEAIVKPSSSTSSVTTTGGDSISLAGTNSIYAYSSLNSGRTSLTDNQLSTLLAGGSATDASGTKYGFTQSIVPGNTQLTFGNSQSEAIDPSPMIQIGTNPDVADSTGSGPIFNYTLSFTKSINVSDSTNVQGYSSIKILGREYIVGASSSGTDLYLYGSGQSASVEEGETKTVTFKDKEHTISLKGTSSSTAATVIVDGVSKAVNKGASYSFPGDFNIYIKDLFHATKTGTLSNAQLLLGADTIHLVNNSQVKYGVDDTTVQNTRSVISSNGNAVSKIVISQASKDSTRDYILAGESFTDRVFGGVKINFASLDPSLNSSSRQNLVIDTDNSVSARILVDTALNGKKKNGDAVTPAAITFARDGDGISDTALKFVNLTRSSTAKISNAEGQNITVNDWVMVNAGDNGRILELTSVGAGTSATDKTVFKDIWTGDEFEFTTGVTNGTSNTIDAATYYVATTATGGNGRSANITWGPGATVGSFGTQRTVFPRIKLKNGGWFTILSSFVFNNQTAYSLPGVDSLSGYESGSALSHNSTANASFNTLSGKVNYTVNWKGQIGNVLGYTNPMFLASNYSVDIPGAGSYSLGELNNVTIGGSNCDLNRTAILFQEPKTTVGSGSTNGDVFCIPITTEGTTTVMPSIGTPVSSDNNVTTLVSLNSVNTKSQGLSTFGTLVELDSTQNNIVKLSSPSSQMVATILVAAPSTTVTGGSSSSESSGATTVTTVMTVMDSEVASVSTKNLIVVGGSCINTVAAKLLGSTTPLCGADFMAKSGAGAGSYVLQSFDSPYTTGKVATLVAGYNAADTTSGVKFLTTQANVDVSPGKKYLNGAVVDTTATLKSTTTTTANTTANTMAK